MTPRFCQWLASLRPHADKLALGLIMVLLALEVAGWVVSGLEPSPQLVQMGRWRLPAAQSLPTEGPLPDETVQAFQQVAAKSTVARAARRPKPATKKAPPHPIQVNTANAAEWEQLPGIGPVLAQRILAERSRRGGRFETAEDLIAVKGIGEKKLAKLLPYLRFS